MNRVQSARSRVADTANSIALQAAQAFLEIQRTAQIRGIADRNVRAHEALLGKVRVRADGGRGATSEIAQAQARFQSARAAKVEADARYKDAIALFKAVVGTNPPARVTPAAAPVGRLPKSVDVAVTEALKGAPAIIARMFDAQAAAAAINVARAEFYPRSPPSSRPITPMMSIAPMVAAPMPRRMLVYRQNLYRGGIDSARVAKPMPAPRKPMRPPI